MPGTIPASRRKRLVIGSSSAACAFSRAISRSELTNMYSDLASILPLLLLMLQSTWSRAQEVSVARTEKRSNSLRQIKRRGGSFWYICDAQPSAILVDCGRLAATVKERL